METLLSERRDAASWVSTSSPCSHSGDVVRLWVKVGSSKQPPVCQTEALMWSRNWILKRFKGRSTRQAGRQAVIPLHPFTFPSYLSVFSVRGRVQSQENRKRRPKAHFNCKKKYNFIIADLRLTDGCEVRCKTFRSPCQSLRCAPLRLEEGQTCFLHWVWGTQGISVGGGVLVWKAIMLKSKACKSWIISYHHHNLSSFLFNDVLQRQFVSHWCGKVSVLMTSLGERFESSTRSRPRSTFIFLLFSFLSFNCIWNPACREVIINTPLHFGTGLRMDVVLLSSKMGNSCNVPHFRAGMWITGAATHTSWCKRSLLI